MATTDSKLKHLEFIQNTINRMASNSFLLKGWAVTLVSALLALSFKETSWLYIVVSLSVLTFFWLLDSYYLGQERAYIRLYEHAIEHKGEADFSMDAKSHRAKIAWYTCAFSDTMRLFYGGLFAVHVLVLLIILNT